METIEAVPAIVCCGCKKEFYDWRYGNTLCPDCRRHLEIGRMVESLEPHSALYRHDSIWTLEGRHIKTKAGNTGANSTPLEALRRGKERQI